MSQRMRKIVVKNGMMPQSEERPPLLLQIFRLYRGDMLFRGLLDLMVIGLIVVGAKADWSRVATALSSAGSVGLTYQDPRELFRGVLAKSTPFALPQAERLVHGPAFGGQAVNDLVRQVRLDKEELERTTEPLRSKLVDIANAMDAFKVQQALEQVNSLDDKDPTVAYVKAVVLMRQIKAYDPAQVFPLLKRATERAVYPAYIVLGNALVVRVDDFEMGAKSSAHLVIVDDIGTVHETTREELLAKAALAYERAASFGRASGLRLLGVARARGWGGKRDLVGAAALWKQAAAAGDPVAQHELARLLHSGSGIQADPAEAERLYRATLETVPASQVTLATLLLPKAIKGDEAAALEALSLLEHYEKEDHSLVYSDHETRRTIIIHDDLRELAFWLHGKYLLSAAPAHLRDPEKALLKFEQAAMLGNAESAYQVAEGLRLGAATPRDPSCAYGFYLAIQPANPSKINPILIDLESEIGANGVRRGKTIAANLRPNSPMAQINYVAMSTSDKDSPILCRRFRLVDPTATSGRQESFEDVMRKLSAAAEEAGLPPSDLERLRAMERQ